MMAAIKLPKAGAVCAALTVGTAASLVFHPLAFGAERLFRSGDLGAIYARHVVWALIPLGIFWALTGLVLVVGWWLIAGGRAWRSALAMALLHGAACGLIYVYFLALVFFDPDDFIDSGQRATPWNYSLWSWELYPAFSLSGAICGLVAWLVFKRLAAESGSHDRQEGP